MKKICKMFNYNLVNNKIIISVLDFKETFSEFSNVEASLIMQKLKTSKIYINDENKEDELDTELRAMAIYYCTAHLLLVATGGDNTNNPDLLQNADGGVVKEAKQGEVSVKNLTKDNGTYTENEFGNDEYGRNFLAITDGMQFKVVRPMLDNANYDVIY